MSERLSAGERLLRIFSETNEEKYARVSGKPIISETKKTATKQLIIDIILEDTW